MTMNCVQSAASAVNFTDAAASKVWELICEEENFDLKLRAFVTGGGCSGLQYGFTFEEIINEDDTVIDKVVPKLTSKDEEDEEGGGEGGVVQLLIDPMSFQYLMGAEIDYDAAESQFVIRNPNAKTTCGCGSSFAA